MAKGLLNVRMTGATRTKRLLQSYANIPAALFARQELQKIMLQRTRERFYPKGRSGGQKDPDGKQWPSIAESTFRRRKINKRRDQALVESGRLRRAISILSGSSIRASELASPSGAGFSIGIKPGDPSEKYGRVQNFGGRTPRGARIPPRRFLGVGRGDVRAVDLYLKSLVVKAARGGL